MVKSTSAYKEHARKALKGRWLLESGIIFVVSIICYLLPLIMAVLIPYIGGIVGRVLTAPLLFGLVRRYVFMDHGGYPMTEEIFHYYDRRYLPDVVFLVLLFSLRVTIYSFLFVIPGVIAYYHYVLYQHVMVDYPEKSTEEILSISARMMDGYKIDFLKLQLSFMGWNILAGMTVIGIVPLMVYKRATYAHFYNEVRRAYEGVPNGEPLVIY